MSAELEQVRGLSYPKPEGILPTKLSELHGKSDVERFAEAAGWYGRPIYAAVYSIVRHPETAEDLTQESLLKAFNGWGNFEDRKEGNIPAWLFRIAKNATFDYLRRGRIRKTIPLLDWYPYANDVESDGRDAEFRKAYENALAKLNPEQALAFKLGFEEEMKYSDVGTIMGKSERAVKMIVFRTKVKLRNELSSYDPDNS